MIKLSDIQLAFDGKTVLRDFSMDIAEKSKTVILGSSGIGKTSLFSLVLGFVAPDKGQIFFDGVLVDSKSVWPVRRKIAYVDQGLSIMEMKVSAWLDFVFSLKANSADKPRADEIDQLFDFFELSSAILSKDTSSLSGGERQRLAIITAILLKRKVFLLDEITSSLDKKLKAKTVDYFLQLDDCTVVVISHDHIWLDNRDVKIFDMETGKWR